MEVVQPKKKKVKKVEEEEPEEEDPNALFGAEKVDHGD